MAYNKMDKKYQILEESIVILLRGSMLSIPFNVLLGFLLALYLTHLRASLLLIIGWFTLIIFISLLRIAFSFLVIKSRWYVGKLRLTLGIFYFLLFTTAILWASAYFLFLPTVQGRMAEAVIVLFLGGMCVGSLASLSVILPAFYVFFIPTFLPIVLYNFYQFQTNRIIMAFMFSFFIIGLSLFAKISSSLWQRVFHLHQEKDSLIGELQGLNEKLASSAITDSLTGLYNRRHFDDMVSMELDRAKRNQYPINLALIDIDNFKVLNDNFGHLYGDQFLIKFSTFLSSSIKRANDTLYRQGGDEFAVIMVNSKLEEGKHLFESIIQKFFQKNHLTDHPQNIASKKITDQVTLSIGLINVPPDYNQTTQYIVNEVDKALYQAKRNGKNQMIAKIIQ